MSKLERAREKLERKAARGPGFSPYAARRLEELRLEAETIQEENDGSNGQQAD
jgi:hypothetical protein